MNFRCDAVAWTQGFREEVRPNFAGEPELRQAILDAANDSDEVRLAELRRQYRHRRQDDARSITARSAPPRSSVIVREQRIDPALTLTGIACTWGATTLARTGGGEPVYVRLGRHSLDDWLGHRDADVFFIWAHASDFQHFGTLASASTDDVGLLVTAALDDRPASRSLLEAGDNGRLGLSVHAEIEASEATGENVRGRPVFTVTRASLTEISFALDGDQSDPACVITEVGGRAARYLGEQAAQRRDQRLRKVFMPSARWQGNPNGFAKWGP